MYQISEDLSQDFKFLQQHYNPIVRKIVHLFLSNKTAEIQYKGNPLNDLTGMKVLKRFSLQPLKQSGKSFNKEFNPESILFNTEQNLFQQDLNSLQIYCQTKQEQIKKEIKKKKP